MRSTAPTFWRRVLLLTAIVLGAYWTYVRVMEKRTVTELSGRHAVRELGVGLGLGALLFSVTIGILAAVGVPLSRSEVRRSEKSLTIAIPAQCQPARLSKFIAARRLRQRSFCP